uniref:Uncharacterized protein n=1 Tax=Aegilops tauschii subsp. strangulata TaxID=200361 RepID=A0A453HP88_AEGTS
MMVHRLHICISGPIRHSFDPKVCYCNEAIECLQNQERCCYILFKFNYSLEIMI